MAPLRKLPDALPTPEFLRDGNARDHHERQLAQLKIDRSPHEPDWRDITQNIKPTRGRYLLKSNELSKRPNIINGRVTQASRTCSAGLKAGIASPVRPWFKLGLDDRELMKYGPVKTWLYETTKALYSIFNGSNFYNALSTVFADEADFGNACYVIDEDYEDVIRATAFAPGEYYFGTSRRNQVNVVARNYTVTVMQLIEQFGIDVISKNARNAYDSGNYGAKIELVHTIEPNLWLEHDVRGWRNMPFHASYYERNGDDKQYLERKGYNEWPAPSPRWDLMAGDIYGSGPGLVALGDAKSIQVLERRKAQGIDKMITPSMQAPIHLRTTGINHMPGGATYYDPASAQGGQAIRPAYEVSAYGVQQVREEIRENTDRINSAYFVDLFMMISQSDRREITAREIDERHEEKLFALGPMLERNHDENLSLAINRTYSVAVRSGKIPMMPREMVGRPVRIEYISMLAAAQKAATVNSIERGLGFIGQISASKPVIIEKINMERTVDEYFEAIGAPQSILSTEEEYKKAREAIEQQMAQQTQAAQGAQMVDSAKLLSETDTSRQNALTDLLRISGAST